MRRSHRKGTKQNNHFVNNTKQGKAGKGYENRPIIYHLNKSFEVVFSNELGYIFDGHIIKFR